jgi:4-amino-4-deoxy-L-arabinose transferase-like glycosyltransferase
MRVSQWLRHSRQVLVLVGLWFLLFSSFALFRPPLLDDADSVHAEAAREMLQRHDYVTLYANGIRYLEKAPLLYWLMAGSMRLFRGPGGLLFTAAARLPLALAVLALIFAVRSLGRNMFDSGRAGFYAALVMMTAFGTFIFTRFLIPDILVALWVTLAMLFFWRTLDTPEHEETPALMDCLGFAACCALGMLTKGFIGVVFPVAIVLIYLFCTRNLIHLLRCHPARSILLFLFIVVPWHWAAAHANPTQGIPGVLPTQGNVRGFTWFYFVNDQVLRYLNKRIPRDYGTVPLWLFWGLILVWLMPWSAFLFKALRRVPLWTGVKREPLPHAEPHLLCGLWALIILLFFSFSTRQEYYVLPALPALALLIGAWLNREHLAAEAGGEFEDAGMTLRAGRRISLVMLWLGVLGAAAAIFYVVHAPAPAPGTDISAALRQNPSDYVYSFGHFLDLHGTAMGYFRWPLLITAAALLVGTVGNYFFRRRRRPGTANMFVAGMATAFLCATLFALVTFSPVLSSKVLADAIKPELDASSLLVVNGEYEDASSLAFYTGMPLHMVNGRSSDLWYGSFFSDAPAVFETEASLAAEWGGPRRIFVWTRAGALAPMPGAEYVIAQSGGKEIVSNQPNHGGASF